MFLHADASDHDDANGRPRLLIGVDAANRRRPAGAACKNHRSAAAENLLVPPSFLSC
jgi:hypothetical protein